MAVAQVDLALHQVADHLVHQPLSPVIRGDGQTPERVVEAAAAGDQLAVVKDAAAVVQIPVTADALLLEERVHLRLGPCIPRGDFAQGNGHGNYLTEKE